jgi:chemotaxis signal transduction protein
MEIPAEVYGLEFRIGRARFGVPTESVARIVEYQTLPLPLAKPWIGGIGLLEGAPLISLTLRPSKDKPKAGALVKAILLKTTSMSVSWALTVEEVYAFVQARLVTVRESGPSRLPRWLSVARTPDGRSLGWVNVGTMLLDLVGLPGELS